MKKILLNCTPPYKTNMPFLAVSTLKAFMQHEGVETDIFYWNLKQENTLKRFCGLGDLLQESSFYHLLPFQAVYAVERDDREVLKRIKYLILSARPDYQKKGSDMVDRYIRASVDYLVREIDYYIDSLHLEQYAMIGFPCHFNQWIPASVIVGRIKQRYPDIPVVIGGLQNKTQALAMMNSISLFDYAIWGEGEYVLLDLYHALEEKKTDLTRIPKLVYREAGEIKSTQAGSRYMEFKEQIFPDYSDFIKEIGKPNPGHCLPLEGSRGCSWHRCHFCFLSTGYRPRAKGSECLLAEIDHQIKATGIRSFQFADADLFGTLGDSLEDFLDKLIEYKNKVDPHLQLRGIEVITRDVTFDIIRKIGMLGVYIVHIGYESPSNELLKKIEKKNSFASNLFFNKWARHFGITSVPFQVIQSMLEETTDDICESIDNLHFLRFMLDDNYWKHNYSTLVINTLSPYYKMMEQGKFSQQLNNDSFEAVYLPKGIVKPEDEKTIFFWTVDTVNPMWKKFTKVENFYITHAFAYTLHDAGEYVVYDETVKGESVRRLEFNKKSEEYRILEAADKRVVSLHDLAGLLAYGEEQLDELKKTVDNLKDLGLVYASNDYSEIITVIIVDSSC